MPALIQRERQAELWSRELPQVCPMCLAPFGVRSSFPNDPEFLSSTTFHDGTQPSLMARGTTCPAGPHLHWHCMTCGWGWISQTAQELGW